MGCESTCPLTSVDGQVGVVCSPENSGVERTLSDVQIRTGNCSCSLAVWNLPDATVEGGGEAPRLMMMAAMVVCMCVFICV